MAAAGLLLVFVCLWARVAWIQIALHARYVARAERNQEQRVLVPAVRGPLLDRGGRPLVRDLLTCSVSAAPREMRDPAATARDLARELRLDPARLARAFDARPNFVWVARRVDPGQGERISQWNRRGVYVSVERRREHVLGDAALEVLGRTNVDHVGIEGLELQLDEDVRGRAGWTTVRRDARGRSIGVERGLRREPLDGREAVLTLDADLQSILETHLARAVDTLRAARGFGLFLDPRTGEILACANVPHLQQGRARNWNFTDQFEPGSTFKIVTYGAALEESVIRPAQWFEGAASGCAKLAPGAVFTDVHAQPQFTTEDAVRWSSNIVAGRIGLLLGDQRLYRYAVDLGFGSATGLGFPGEAGGKLRGPQHWSARSGPTVAIGYEVSVTSLQLALAYAAVANGGVLMEPMLVREIREPGGRAVRRFAPHATRRVFSARTADLLARMLTAVVDSGTATSARVPGLAIAGKTGTAWKFDARRKTYDQRRYIASFAGFVPADDPRLVGVIVIDDPRGRHYYGGRAAAPVFREVLRELQRLPRGPFDPGVAQIAVRPPSPSPVQVPDLRLLPVERAGERLARNGLRLRVRGSGPRVLAQDPPPGAAAERGASIVAWLSAPADSTAGCMPDLAGLPLRQALRRLTGLQLQARIHGQGSVVRQQPEPGTPLAAGRRCELWCERIPPSPPAGDGAAVAAWPREAP